MLFEQIQEFLNSKSIPFKVYEHEEVFTSEEASKVRPGIVLHQGAKAIILTKKYKAEVEEDFINKFVMVIIPGDMRINTKSLKKELNLKDLTFANPEDVLKLSGVKPGAVPPFGNLFGLQVYFAKEAFEDVTEIAFNPGRHDRTIVMSKEDYIKSVEPVLGEYAKG